MMNSRHDEGLQPAPPSRHLGAAHAAADQVLAPPQGHPQEDGRRPHEEQPHTHGESCQQNWGIIDNGRTKNKKLSGVIQKNWKCFRKV